MEREPTVRRRAVPRAAMGALAGACAVPLALAMDMSRIELVHEGGTRFRADIRGHRVIFDQPPESGGEDRGPTPPEMFVASLAGCVGYHAGRFLERHGRSTDGLGVHATFVLGERPARVVSVDLAVVVPPGLEDALRAPLLAVVEHCTVSNSIRLAPAVRISVASGDAQAAAPAA